MKAVALVLVLALGGCTAEMGPPAAPAHPAGSTPTGSAPAVAASPSGAAKETDHDKALRYTRCMAEHGEPVAEPVEGTPLQIGTPTAGGWTIVGTPAFKACRQFLPATWPVKVDPADIERERPFGECVRRHGIAWPEPDANGMLAYPADPMSQDTAEYRAAEDACRHLYDDPANNAER